MLTNGQKEAVLKSMMELEVAHQQLATVNECPRRESAYKLIEEAHQAVALLLIMK